MDAKLVMCPLQQYGSLTFNLFGEQLISLAWR